MSSYLSALDVRKTHDRMTGSLVLQFTGRRVRFHQLLEGYKPGVFFAVVVNEVPFPETLETFAASAGVSLNVLPLGQELRMAIAEALCAEAMLQAPELLAPMSSPRVYWMQGTASELQRKAVAAENKVTDITRLIERELQRRIASRTTREVAPPSMLFEPVPPPHTYAPWMPSAAPPRSAAPIVEEIEEPAEEEEETPEASPAATKRIEDAAKAAREQELPQRLPSGARRRLGQLPAGIYLSNGTSLDKKANLCAAMMDGQESSKRGGEAVLIDWDTEWPVVLRRYGAHGRVIYRVEDALRRAGLAPNEGEAA